MNLIRRFFRISRLRLAFLLFALILTLPAFGLNLASAMENRRRAEENAIGGMLSMVRMLSLAQERQIEASRQALAVLADLARQGNGDPEFCRQELTKQLERFPQYNFFVVMDQNGQVTCNVMQVHFEDLHGRRWFQYALSSRQFTVGEYRISPFTGTAELLVAYPFEVREGHLSVMIAALNMEWLREAYQQSSLPHQSVITLTDASSIVLLRLPDPIGFIGRPIPEENFIPLKEDPTQVIIRGQSLDQVPRIFGVERLYNSVGDLVGYLFVGIPEVSLYREANQTLRRDAVLLGLVVLLSALLAWSGSEVVLLKNIRQMVRTTQQIADGDFSTRTGMTNEWGELGVLGRAIDDMARALMDRERKVQQAVSALEESEALFRSLALSTSSAIFVYRGDKFIYLNPACEVLTGYPLEELRHIPFWQIVHPEDREMVRDRGMARQRGEQVPNHYEFRILTKNGQTRWLDFTATLIQYMGQPAGLGTAFDITARKLAEATLRKSEQSFRLMFFNNPLPMYVYDQVTLQFLDVNRAALELYGYTREEFLAKRLPDLYHPEESKTLQEWLSQRIPGQLHSGESLHVLKDGHIIAVEEHAHSLPFEQREAVLVVVYDITDRKKAERVLQRNLIELQTLYAVAVAGVESEDEDELISRFVKIVRTAFQLDHLGVGLLNETGDAVIVHPASYSGDENVRYESIPIDKGITGKVARTGITCRLSDVRLDPDYLEVRSQVRSELCVPIKLGGKVIGVVNAESYQLNAFSETDEHLLNALVGVLSSAFDRLRYVEAERRRRLEAEKLREVGAALTATRDLNTVLERILDNLREVVEYTSASIFLFVGNSVVMAAQRGLPASVVQELPRHIDRLSTSSIEQAKKGPMIIPDTRQSSRWQVLSGVEYIACWMGIPLVVEGRPIGMLNLDHQQAGFYTQEHLALAAGFAHQAAIAIDNARLFHELEQSNRDLIKAYDETIEGWSRALELRDQETEEHTQRVTEMTVELARAYGVPEEDIAHIRRGALLHDIGKMGIPDSILLKSGELTEEEREIMRMHPVLAYRMLSDISFLRKAMEIPYYHHEHWDGNGYPFGLKGEKIPLSARLFAIVDVWDALRSDRPYRKAWSRAEVIEYIRSLSGKQFDPHVVEIFLKMV